MNLKNFALILAVLAAIITYVSPAPAATTYVQDGDVIDILWSGTAPAAGAPVVKGTATGSGVISGIALKAGTTTTAAPVLIRGVVKVPVQALTNPMAIGDYVYSTVTDVNTCTASCTNTNTGVIFGKILQALVVASNTQTVPVLLINH